MSDYLKRLTYSEVNCGYLNIEKKYSEEYPNLGEKVTIKTNNHEGVYKMHSTQPGRIDGLTKLYRIKRVKVGDIAHVTFCTNNELCISFSNGKNLFEIEIDKKDLSSVLEDIREHISEDFTYFCHNETNVRIELIEPILKAIGWNLPNLQREKYLSKCGTIDFGLYDNDQCLLIIEAKSLENPLNADDQEIDVQISKYLRNIKNVRYYILTNGEIWKLFNRNNEMLQAINVFEIDKENEIEAFFQLFSKKNSPNLMNCTSDLGTGIPFKTPIGLIKRNDNFKVIETKEATKKVFEGSHTQIFKEFVNDHSDTISRLQKEQRITTIIDLNSSKKPIKISNNGKRISWECSFWKKKMIAKIIKEAQLNARIEDVELA